MNETHLAFCHEWFESYVENFKSPDRKLQENIDLKRLHTLRVCGNAVKIARSLHLGGEKLCLAEAVALFHDLGRFEQLRRHNTFSDKVSMDHAALGVNLLNESAPLEGLTEVERIVLQRAIWNHNKYDIPYDEESDVLLFSRIIRDADKLDILKVITDHFRKRVLQPNSALDFGLSEKPGHSKGAVEDISNRRMVRIDKLENLNDMRLMYLSWVFDLNFPVTVSLVLEEPYLEMLMNSLPKDGDMQVVCSQVKGYLNERRLMYISAI